MSDPLFEQISLLHLQTQTGKHFENVLLNRSTKISAGVAQLARAADL